MRRVVVILVLHAAVCFSQPVQLAVTPAFQAIAIDSIAKVKVRIQTSVRVRAYQVEVGYNPSLLKCVYADKSTFFPLGGSLLFITIDSVNGRITIDEAMIGPTGRNGEGDLAEIRFRGLQNGTGSLPLPTAFVRDTLNQSVAFAATGASVRVGTGTSVGEDVDVGSHDLRLSNYPNPFNASTTILYSSKSAGLRSRLQIHNVLGQLVRDFSSYISEKQTGEIVWDGRDDNGQSVASGVYVVHLAKDGKNVHRIVQLIK
jgi:hypothetical protein